MKRNTTNTVTLPLDKIGNNAWITLPAALARRQEWGRMIHNDKRLSHAVLDIAQLLFMALIVIA